MYTDKYFTRQVTRLKEYHTVRMKFNMVVFVFFVVHTEIHNRNIEIFDILRKK